MKNILDEDLVEKSVNDYTKEAFGKFKIAAIFFVFVIMLNVSSMTRVNELVSFMFSLLAIFFSFSALIPSVSSFSLKEEDTFKKWISLVGSIFIIAIFLSLIVMILLDDLMNSI